MTGLWAECVSACLHASLEGKCATQAFRRETESGGGGLRLGLSRPESRFRAPFRARVLRGPAPREEDGGLLRPPEQTAPSQADQIGGLARASTSGRPSGAGTAHALPANAALPPQLPPRPRRPLRPRPAARPPRGRAPPAGGEDAARAGRGFLRLPAGLRALG